MPHDDGYASRWNASLGGHEITVPDGELIYIESFFNAKISDRSLEYLQENDQLDWRTADWRALSPEAFARIAFTNIRWRQDRIRHYGKERPLPRLTAHVAEWQVIYTATLVAAVVLLLYPLMPGPWAMGLCSVLLGLALGAVQPMILVVLHRISPEARQGEAMALRVMTINSSSFVLPMMFGSIGAVTGVAGLFWLVAAVLAVGSRSVPKLRDVQPHG
mgnify:CR=1 FL=1